MPDVETLIHEGVLELRLARPRKKNALTDEMYGALADGFAVASADPRIAAVVLSAEGPTFSAGNDLMDFVGMVTQGVDPSTRNTLRFLLALTTLDRPLVAAVQGEAVGVGTTMLFHCDLVYADETARFSTPFAQLGLTPEGGSSVLMPARLGYARAFAMLALAEPMDAQAMYAAGLVNEVVPAGGARDRALAAAHKLAGMPREALLAARKLLRPGGEALRQAILDEGAVFWERTKSAEAQAAFQAFLSRPRA